MSEYFSIVTTQGLAKQIRCIADQTNFDIAEIAVGDMNNSDVTLSENMTSLVHEMWRGAITSNGIENGKLYACVNIPSNVGNFTIKEIGLFDSDGTLLCIGKCPATYKFQLTNGSLQEVFIKIYMDISNSDLQNLIVQTSVNLASVDYVNQQFATRTFDNLKPEAQAFFDAKQDVLSEGENIRITNNIVSAPNVLTNSRITNCILSAPNGVVDINSNGQTVVHRGLKFLSANGTNSDNTINNIEGTLPNDIVFSNSFPSNSNGKHKLFLSKERNSSTWIVGGRALPSQWFEQEDYPFNAPDATWYNPKDHKWRNIRTADGDGRWYEFNVIPLADVTITNGNITSVDKIYFPAEILTYSNRLTNLNECDYDTPVSIPYNTIFTSPYDGKIHVFSQIYSMANVNAGNDKIVDIIGLSGKNLSTSTIISLKQAYTTPRSYTINIPSTGWYSMILIGGGGYGASHINSMGYMSYASGGSGAGFAGDVYLTAGNHTITVGGANANSSIDNIIIAGGGGNGNYGPNYALDPSGGAGGTLTINGQTQNVTLQTNGYSGSSSNGNIQQAGGASVYGGYGAGGASNGSPTNGYIYIQKYEAQTDTNGTQIYRHCNHVRWDGSANTVSHDSSHSAIIEVSRLEQVIFKSLQQNGTITAFSAIFYPKKREIQ